MATRELTPPDDNETSAAVSERPQSREDFNIAIICALELESDAVEAIFDKFWEGRGQPKYGKAPGDTNTYTLGLIEGHNVVLAYMPGMGKVEASSVATNFVHSFPNIRLGLVVGICGGVPNAEHYGEPIFMGDVIVSTRVVQSDFGRLAADRFVRKDTVDDNLPRASPEIRGFLRKQKGMHGRGELRDSAFNYIAGVCGQNLYRSWRRLPSDEDKLYRPDYRHKHRSLSNCEVCANCTAPNDPVCKDAPLLSCASIGCDREGLVSWYERRGVPHDTDPKTHAAETPSEVHFGNIASSDAVVKSAQHRDQTAEREEVIAFEMEGAGVWDKFQTIVIKGVSDYSDSHKDNRWKKYAALAAAGYAKALLEQWPVLERRPQVNRGQTTSSTIATPATNKVFNNTGSGFQGETQNFHAPIYQGHRTVEMNRGGVNYGSQVGLNYGSVNNNDYRRR